MIHKVTQIKRVIIYIGRTITVASFCTQISFCPKCCIAVSAGYDEPGTPLGIWPFVPSRWWPLDLMELMIPDMNSSLPSQWMYDMM